MCRICVCAWEWASVIFGARAEEDRVSEGAVCSVFPGCALHPNPARILVAKLPGGAENCNSAPNCHFRARPDSQGEVV